MIPKHRQVGDLVDRDPRRMCALVCISALVSALVRGCVGVLLCTLGCVRVHGGVVQYMQIQVSSPICSGIFIIVAYSQPMEL